VNVSCACHDVACAHVCAPLLEQIDARTTTLRRQHGRACADRCADPVLYVQVIDQLGVRPTAPQRPGAPAPAGPPRRQFILPLEDPACETSMNNILTGVTHLGTACAWFVGPGQLIVCVYARTACWVSWDELVCFRLRSWFGARNCVWMALWAHAQDIV
jgi:hypothetical protein